MDQGPLVREQIDSGRELVERLSQQHFDVSAAFWIKTLEEGRWMLYIASSLVDSKGPIEAYKELHRVLSSPEDVRLLDEFNPRLIGVRNPTVKDVLEIRDRRNSKLTIPIRYFGPQLGNMDLEEAYIYSRERPEVLK